jgi:hypothetical protein
MTSVQYALFNARLNVDRRAYAAWRARWGSLDDDAGAPLYQSIGSVARRVRAIGR